MFALITSSLAIITINNVKANSPSEAKVLSDSFYVAPSNPTFGATPGDLIIVGEIQNVGQSTIDNATVQGSALDANGQVLATATGIVFSYEMLPGKKAPFYIDLSAQSSSKGDLSWVQSVSNVTVTVASVIDTLATSYSGLTIPNEGGISRYTDPVTNTYEVIGVVENTGNQITGNVWVVATFYNAAGTVVAANFTSFLTPSLSPDQPLRFVSTPIDDTSQLTNEIATYAVVIYSMPASTQPTSTTITSTPTATVSNSLAPTILIVVIAVIIVAVIVALLLIKKSRKLPPPPPPPI